jgi:hypothetical protein
LTSPFHLVVARADRSRVRLGAAHVRTYDVLRRFLDPQLRSTGGEDDHVVPDEESERWQTTKDDG